MQKILSLKNVNKNFGSFKALKNVNMNVYDGDIYGLVGPNGAGKSTILKTVAHWQNPDGGEIEIFGKVGSEARASLSKMGFLIEDSIFYEKMKGIDNLKYLSKLKKIDMSEALEIIREFEMEEKLSKIVKTYSMGQRKALGLAAAVMNCPKILVLDEPVNGLDPEKIVLLRNLILKMNREWKTTVIVSSHILNELSLIATRYGFIKKGELIEEVTREELLEKTERYLYILVDKSEISHVVALLEKNFYMKNYRVYPKGELRVFDKLQIKEVQKFLIEHDIYAKGIEYKMDSLEDYYLKIIGGKKNV